MVVENYLWQLTTDGNDEQQCSATKWKTPKSLQIGLCL